MNDWVQNGDWQMFGHTETKKDEKDENGGSECESRLDLKLTR